MNPAGRGDDGTFGDSLIPRQDHWKPQEEQCPSRDVATKL